MTEAVRDLVTPHSDTGIDGQNPVEIDELDLLAIDPLPPYVWYQDMVDFADRISDEMASQRLKAALQGAWRVPTLQEPGL